MVRIRRGLAQRFKGFRKNPRHFVQLFLPVTLVLLGWLALAFDWRRLSFLLVSAALIVFAGLLWMRLRRIQARIDTVLRRTAALQAQTLEIASKGRTAPAGLASTELPLVGTPPDDLRSPHEDAVLPALTMASGVPAGLLKALEEAAPGMRDETLLVVPEYLREVSATWAHGITGTSWRTLDQRQDNGLQRACAAALDIIIIVDGEEGTDFRGVLDQSFFWWLPESARLFVVSDDAVMFASRLSAAHEVEFALVEAWSSSARIVVTRTKGAMG